MARQMCKVWNKNPHTIWKEEFKGKTITIPINGFVEMELYEASEFMGQFSPIRKKEDDTLDEKSFKTLVKELILEEEDTGEEEGHEIFVCHADGKAFTTQEALDKHMKKNYANRPTVQEPELDKVIKKRGRPPGATSTSTVE